MELHKRGLAQQHTAQQEEQRSPKKGKADAVQDEVDAEADKENMDTNRPPSTPNRLKRARDSQPCESKETARERESNEQFSTPSKMRKTTVRNNTSLHFVQKQQLQVGVLQLFQQVDTLSARLQEGQQQMDEWKNRALAAEQSLETERVEHKEFIEAQEKKHTIEM